MLFPKDRAMAFLSRHFLWLVAVVGLLVYSFTYFSNCFGPPIRSDGEGYYAYLPALLIYGDLSFERLAAERYDGVIPSYTYIRPYSPTGKYLDSYTIGVALLMLPFFLVAHVLTFLFQSPPGGFEWWQFNYSMDGYSLFYQHVIGMAGMAYLIGGLVFLRKVLARYFPEAIVWATLVIVLFGTNLFHYGTGESVTSHIYSFMLVSLLLYLVPAWYERSCPLGLSVGLGLVMGVLVLVRPLNLLLVVPLAGFCGIDSLRDVPGRIRLLASRWKRAALVLLVVAVVFFPQSVVWKYATGHFFIYQYYDQQGFFDFTHPQWAGVLFSVKKGLFFWFPVLLLALPGLFFLRRQVRELAWPVWMYLALQLYIISSYCFWWAGGCFGNRYFVESMPVLALPVAACLRQISSRPAKVIFGCFVVASLLFTCFLLKMYYTREVPFDGLDDRAFFDILWLRKQWVLDWGCRLFAP